MRLHVLCHAFFVRDFLTGFSCFFGAVVRFPYEISCFGGHNFGMRFPYKSPCFLLCNLRMSIHVFWAATKFPFEISCFLALMRFHEIS
jgi:hypothetical protein